MITACRIPCRLSTARCERLGCRSCALWAWPSYFRSIALSLLHVQQIRASFGVTNEIAFLLNRPASVRRSSFTWVGVEQNAVVWYCFCFYSFISFRLRQHIKYGTSVTGERETTQFIEWFSLEECISRNWSLAQQTVANGRPSNFVNVYFAPEHEHACYRSALPLTHAVMTEWHSRHNYTTIVEAIEIADTIFLWLRLGMFITDGHPNRKFFSVWLRDYSIDSDANSTARRQ